MKKLSGEYILLFFQMTFVGIFVLVIYSYYVTTEQQSFLDRSMYSENVMGIQLSNSYLVSKMNERVDLSIDSISTDAEFALYRNVADEFNEIVRGIYENGDLFGYSKYIENGRFFDRNDFDNHAEVAVIGSDMLELTYTQDGRRYYGYEDTLYEVIGIFRQTDSDLDHTIFLNLTVLLDSENDYGLYYVDSLNKTTVDAIIQKIEETAIGSYTTSKVKYESKATNIGLGYENSTLLICAILSVVFNLIITLIYFAIQKKYTSAVQKLCGMTQKDLVFEYGIRIIGMVIMSFVLMLIIVKLFSGNIVFLCEDNLGWQHFVMTGMTLAVMGVLTTLGIVRSVKRVNIGDTLKGR